MFAGMMIRWQIFTPPAVHFAVQEAAKQLGISPGEFTRRALDAALAQHSANSGGEFRVKHLDRGAAVPAAPGLGAASAESPAAAAPSNGDA
jgi:hypothetical protein